MSKSMKVYRYRLKPNFEQSLKLDKWMDDCRWLYNKVLDFYIKDYEIAKHNFYTHRNQYPYYFDKFISENKINKIKINNEFYQYGGRLRNQGKGNMSTYRYYTWLKSHSPPYINLNEIPAVVCQEQLERVENAYKKFFSGGGYPKFKKKNKGNNNSITWTQSPPFDNIKLTPPFIILPKFGKIKLIYHRDIPENSIIKRINITKSNVGKYFINIFVEYKELTHTQTNKIIGIDRNIKLDDIKENREFMVTFDGEKSTKYIMPIYLRKLNKQLTDSQKEQSLHEKGSKEWRRLLQRQRHIWDNINNCKKNWIENITTDFANIYDKIIVEKLEIKDSLMNKEKHKKKASKKKSKNAENIELTRAKQRRRGFGEVSHATFLNRLKQKIGEENIIEVDPAYTSMDCSQCGYRNYQLKLSDREWTCPSCKTIHIRDSNAAINIYNKGIDILSKQILIEKV